MAHSKTIFFNLIAVETQIFVELHQKFNKTITNLQSSLLTQDIIGLEHHCSNPNGHKETCAKQPKTNLANIPHTSTLLQFANSVILFSKDQVVMYIICALLTSEQHLANVVG